MRRKLQPASIDLHVASHRDWGKIPEENRNKLEKRKYQKPHVESEDEDKKKDDSTVNKDEILVQLNLQPSD